MRVLITSGGVEEKIDGVRSIINRSTGSTGAMICDGFMNQGINVTFIQQKRSLSPNLPPNRTITYTSFDELNAALEQELKDHEYDAVIHLAAVSDYSISSIEINGEIFGRDELEKIKSEQSVSIHLKSNFKIINQLKAYACNSIIVIGFKLTNTIDLDEQTVAIKKIFSESNADYIVHNDLHFIDKDQHKTTLYSPFKTISKGDTKEDLSQNLLTLLKDVL